MLMTRLRHEAPAASDAMLRLLVATDTLFSPAITRDAALHAMPAPARTRRHYDTSMMFFFFFFRRRACAAV